MPGVRGKVRVRVKVGKNAKIANLILTLLPTLTLTLTLTPSTVIKLIPLRRKKKLVWAHLSNQPLEVETNDSRLQFIDMYPKKNC